MKSSTSNRKGFTLIEVLIVGILISLFAGLAIFNIQQTYKDSLRKAVVGETRQLGVAMAFAYQDLGVYPKVPLLLFSSNEMQRRGNLVNNNPDFWFLANDYYNRGTTTIADRLKNEWGGGGGAYFAASQTRKNLTAGRGGIVIMRYGNNAGLQLEWPADPWGNPYVFYSVNADINTSALSFIEAPTDTGNYFNGIVSYGPNGIPGLTGTPDERLYNDGPGLGVFDALNTAEYNSVRAEALNKILFDEILDTQGNIVELSDDIVHEF